LTIGRIKYTGKTSCRSADLRRGNWLAQLDRPSKPPLEPSVNVSSPSPRSLATRFDVETAMSVPEINIYDATTAGQMIADGRFTASDYLSACLRRIGERETDVGAWTYIGREEARRQIAKLHSHAEGSSLRGIPVGIKDIIDTHDMPTEHGSPIYKSNIPSADAACVAMLRRAGAIILGKTVTPEFAAVTPGRTVNPRNFKYSPGGSSSGSAAAVADYMVPVAIGSQTVGSTIRPASYCGVVGFMPSHQVLPVQGVKTQAGSLDNLGILTRSVVDVTLVANAILGCDAMKAQPLAKPPHIGFCPSPQWPQAQDSTRRVMDDAISLLRSAGATVETEELPARFDDALDAHWTILAFEFARAMAYEYDKHSAQLSPRLVALLERGFAISFADYSEACARGVERRAEFVSIINKYDALLTPAASGEAPEGILAPSDLLFQRLWTFLHVPAITLPGFVGPNGLPIGIQLIGPHLHDAQLLSAAAWVELTMQQRLSR
jgi:Asp-tRNA(Asn)/Glu-tRNA(Gln) amidotransferase A subunit family amidase